MDPKEEIKNRLDLVEVIQEYIQVKPAGTHAFKALCPFHAEKTPSFHISRAKQMWRCFGCGVGGDMFSFVQQMEGVDFPEALRILGKKAGVEIQRYDTKEANEKASLAQLQGFAAAYYQKVLRDATYAQVARDYCAKRALTSDLIEKFGLGYAPDEWDAFSKIAKQKGFSELDLLNGGLALKRKSGSGVIDRFRHRLMIPLKDVHGNVVGFTGRVLRSEDIPKYMNSPETPLYRKSRILYGLDLAKQAIRKADAVVLVEGNLDVVASHKGGVENVVATSGTALTEEQITLLKRFTTNLIFSFDADAAGFKAAERGIKLAQSLGMNVLVALIPQEMGKDPDDVVQKNPASWQSIVARPVPIMDWLFGETIRGKDITSVNDKKAIGAKLLPEIVRIPDVIEREHWLQKLSALLRVDIDLLREAVPKAEIRNTKYEIRNKGERVNSEGKSQKTEKPRGREELSMRLILGLFIESKDLRPFILERIRPENFPEGDYRQLYNQILAYYTGNQDADNNHLSEPTFAELALEAESLLATTGITDVRQQLETTIHFLKDAAREGKRRILLARLREAESAGDAALAEELSRQFQAL